MPFSNWAFIQLLKQPHLYSEKHFLSTCYLYPSFLGIKDLAVISLRLEGVGKAA